MTLTAPPTASPDAAGDHDPPMTTASWGVPRSVTASAWAVPIMVLGQFAFLAAVPVVLMLRRVLRDPRLGALRWPVSLLAAVYAIPFALWLLNPDRAHSLSKDISPAFVALIVAASALLLTTIWSAGRRRARQGVDEEPGYRGSELAGDGELGADIRRGPSDSQRWRPPDQ